MGKINGRIPEEVLYEVFRRAASQLLLQQLQVIPLLRQFEKCEQAAK